MKNIALCAIVFLSSCLLIISCGKDEDPTPVQNGPKMTSFSPTSGPVGTEIWITGQNFGATIANNIVKIGDVKATITSAKTTEIFVTVPTGATTGKVSVTVNGNTDTGGTFTVTESTNTSISLNKNVLELYTLDNETLVPTISGGESASNIIWSSDDEAIATVDENGTVTGIAEGTATIKADLGNDVSVECIVNVSASIFAVGYEEINGVVVAKFWKNGVATNLTDGTSFGGATSVFVDDTDIYVCGIVDIGFPTAIVWKNGELLNQLTDGTKYGNATSIFVFNGDVYVIGNEELGADNISNATIWKNGVAHATLTDGLNANETSSGEDIFVNESGIYSAGYEESPIHENGTPKLWENNTQIDLTDETYHGRSYSVFASGSDVYAAGYEENDNGIWVAKYWKNGEVTNLSDGTQNAEAQSIFVTGQDVYVAGSYYENQEIMQQAVVWKNGTATNLGTIGSGATSLYVNSGDVYVGGIISDGNITYATIWKNGEEMNLELTEGAGDSAILSVFIR